MLKPFFLNLEVILLQQQQYSQSSHCVQCVHLWNDPANRYHAVIATGLRT